MRQTMDGKMIGRGEDATEKILKMFFGYGLEVKSQVNLKDIVNNVPIDMYDGLSKRQIKETIDFVVYKFHHNKKNPEHPAEFIPFLAVRVNHGNKKKGYSGHDGEGLAQVDRVQKALLEKNRIKVVDLYERECPELFKDLVNYKSVWEVCNGMMIARVET